MSLDSTLNGFTHDQSSPYILYDIKGTIYAISIVFARLFIGCTSDNKGFSIELSWAPP